MTSLLDVARSAGVSKSVASRALNRDINSRISAETAERVRAVAERLNYVPNHKARALRSSRAGALALVVPTVNNAVFADLFAGVQDRAVRAGMTVLLGELRSDRSGQTTLQDLIRQGRVDGAIVQRPEDMDDESLRLLIRHGQPMVLFNSVLVDRPGSVTLPDVAATQMATGHLVELGHQRIAYVGGGRLHDAAERRLRGYGAAMQAAGLQVDEDWVADAGWESTAGARGMAQLLEARRRPTAVVVASVNAALGALSVAAERGLRIPTDLSLISVHDTWVARIFNPALTVVRMPLRRAGEVATEMLLGTLDGQTMADVVVEEPAPSLVVRRSTALPFEA